MSQYPKAIHCSNPNCQKYNHPISPVSFKQVGPNKCIVTLKCNDCGFNTSISSSRTNGSSYDELINQLRNYPLQEDTDESHYSDDLQDPDLLYDYDSNSDNNHMLDEEVIPEYLEQVSGADPRQPNQIQQSNQLPTSDAQKDHHVLFMEAIGAVDKNLPKIDQFNKITDSLDVLSDAPPPVIQVCLEELKAAFHLTARELEGFRKTLTQKQKEFVTEQKRAKAEKRLDQCAREPKVLTEEEKKRALAYLQDPNLVKNISRDIAYAGNLIGEENNKMMLYFASISRKLDAPISLVIFGKSSSGKSYLANTIEEFIPPEDSLSLSSSSGRGFEYIGSQLQHKCVLIQEWEGAENILPTIRTLQSEGKLNRLVTVDDPDSPNQRKSVAMSFKCPCSVVITTTQENIHDENSTRIFELYADESVAQTENIVRASVENADLSKKSNKKEKERIIEMHRDVQRCLEKIDVSIPFADKLTFPKNTTRHRRDVNRFLQLVKVVAFLHQKQKITIQNNGNQYIEADLRDYAIAYNYAVVSG